MAANAALKKKLAAISATVSNEKEWWESKRESVKEGFMKELDDEKKSQKTTSEPKRRPATSAPEERPGSDEDAVLVETPASVGAGGGGGKNKKKRGKK